VEVARIRQIFIMREEEFEMGIEGVLVWFVALIIGFFIGLKVCQS